MLAAERTLRQAFATIAPTKRAFLFNFALWAKRVPGGPNGGFQQYGSSMKFSHIARAQLASGLLAPPLPQDKQASRAEQDRQSRKRMCQFERRRSQDEKEKERAAAL
jgi:hypothetical protein